MSDAYTLHPRLAADTFFLGNFPLCQLLLMNDSKYPWFILVPQRAGIREVFELEEADQTALLRESVALSRALMDAFQGEKLNIAALGNLVPQLHVHHVVRFTADQVWPAPVWGRHPATPYPDAVRQGRIARLLPLLAAGDFKPATPSW